MADGWTRDGRRFLVEHAGDTGIIDILTTTTLGIGAVHVTAELGVSFRAIDKWVQVAPQAAALRGAHWMRRIGNVIGQGVDQWWVLEPGEPMSYLLDPVVSNQPIEGFVDAVVHQGADAVKRHMSYSTVQSAWKTEGEWRAGRAWSLVYAGVLAADLRDWTEIETILALLDQEEYLPPGIAKHVTRLRAEADPMLRS